MIDTKQEEESMSKINFPYKKVFSIEHIPSRKKLEANPAAYQVILDAAAKENK